LPPPVLDTVRLYRATGPQPIIPAIRAIVIKKMLTLAI
jgi:hypothetical protein